MEKHLSDFWHWYIVIISVVSIIACGVLLKMMTTKRIPKGEKVGLHGNTWDEDLQEYNHPLPSWWKWLFYITLVFSLVYMAVYPGLGNFAGSFGWSSAGQYQQEMKQADAEFGPIFAKYSAVAIPELAKDKQAIEIGQRLFLNNCAHCHGSAAVGSKGFPNLADKDWLYGGDPATILATLNAGRNGVMPALGDALGGADGVKAVAQYVRSLSGLQHDAKLAEVGKGKFAVCAACHGNEGKGNRALGAPNLTDNIWLYGSSAETIEEGITLGRNNAMPAQLERLGEAKLHLLAAYVYSLGGGEPPVAVGANEPAAAEPKAAPTATPTSTQK
jgi:cytochrome c oxidase cbb3-type subunit III